MDSLKYKTFVWPNNPHTYKEECTREPQYITQDGVSAFTGMGSMKRIISGSGAFFGEDAFFRFKKLAALFEQSEAGDLVHPIWGTRHCYFTGLELTQEPKENYVSYKFTFTCADSGGAVPK